VSDELEHSSLGPSGAHRWRRCPGSVAYEKLFPDSVGREAAVGTVFHEFASLCLQFGLEPEAFQTGRVYEEDGYEVVFDEEMQVSMHEGLAWIAGQMEEGDLLFVEQRVSIEAVCGPGQFGTCDVCILQVRRRRMVIFDWKYGKGVPVSPIKNDQCYLYGIGCWETFAWKFFGTPEGVEVLFKIEQPRAPGGGGEWETTMEEVIAEGVRIREDATATMDPAAPRIPGHKQCQFCRASGNCPEEREHLLGVFSLSFEEIEEAVEFGVGPAFPDPSTLDLTARSFILLHFKAFKRYVAKVQEIALRELSAGVDLPLLKAVKGRGGRRNFRPDDIAEVADALEDEIGAKAWKTQLISPAEAEKLVGRKRFKEVLSGYCEQSAGKTILVPLDDNRDALQGFVTMYDDLDDEDDNDDD
jgi:hypothetical protein